MNINQGMGYPHPHHCINPRTKSPAMPPHEAHGFRHNPWATPDHQTPPSDSLGLMLPAHNKELKQSAIAPKIIARHFRSLGPEAWEYLFTGEFPDSERRNDGRLRDKWMRNYAHLDNGGWWCSGYDPLTGGDMDWGTFKPDTPRQVQKGDRTKTIKYEHPPKQRTRAFFLNTADYWERVKADPSIAIALTEGSKKTGAIQSLDIPTIGLPGIFSGYRSKDTDGNPIEPTLIPELEAFCQPGREFVFLFDQDTNPKTRRAVQTAIANTGRLLITKGCRVTVTEWDATEGKGIDDVIVSHGAERFWAIFTERVSLSLFKARRAVRHPLGLHQPNLRVSVPCLSAIAPESLPETGTIVIFAPMGTGKTELIKALLQNESMGAIALGNTIGLQRGLSHRLGLDYIDDCDIGAAQLLSPKGIPTHRVGLCFDSLFKIPRHTFPDGSYDLILDEIDQGLRHLLKGGTCGKNGKRPGLVQRWIALVQGARRVICASATLSRWDFELIAALRHESPWILQNDYHHDRFPVELYSGGTRRHEWGTVLIRLQTALAQGQRVMVMSDQKIVVKALEIWAQDFTLNCLSYHADNSSDDEQRAFAANPDHYLSQHPTQLVLASPSLTSGVSITGDHFDWVVGLFMGQTITPADAIQQLGRIRRPIRRLVWCAAQGRGKRETWAETYWNTEAKRTQAIAHFADGFLPTLQGDDPIAQYLAASGARQNLEMSEFGAFFHAHLEREQHPLSPGTISDIDNAHAQYNQFMNAKRDAKEQEYQNRYQAPIVDDANAKTLKDQQALTYHDRCKLERWGIAKFYHITSESLTLDDVKRDRAGQYQQEIIRLECLLYDNLASDRDRAQLSELTRWNAPIFPHDLPKHQLYSEGAKALGLDDLVAKCTKEPWNNRTPWAQDFATFARQRRDDVRTFLGFNLSPTMTPCQIIGMMLKSLGFRTTSTRLSNKDGSRYRQYRIHTEDLAILTGILQRRHKTHTEQGLQLRPCLLTLILLEGMDITGVPPSSPPHCRERRRLQTLYFTPAHNIKSAFH